MTRRRLTKAEKAAMIEAQGFKCGCGCGAPVGMDGHGEHGLPVALGNDAKPDSIWRVECHGRKTKADRARIAKADRQRRKMEQGRGRARKGAPLQSRGFDKRYRKRMDGTVEARQ